MNQIKLILCAFVLGFALAIPGCQSIAEAETALHNTLIKFEGGLTWLAAQNHATIDGYFDQAIALAEKNPTLQKRLIEAKALYDAGDLQSAINYVNLGIVVTTPAPAPVTSGPSAK